jgi:hypothetical protein
MPILLDILLYKLTPPADEFGILTVDSNMTCKILI